MDIFIDCTSRMIYEFLLRRTRTGYDNNLWIPPGKPTFDGDSERITIKHTQQEIERAIRSSEIIDDSIGLPIISIEPFKAIA